MSTPRISRKPHPTLAALSAAVLLVVACSSGSPSPQVPTSGPDPATLTSCGTEVTYPKQAPRIVATSNSANVGALIRIDTVQNPVVASLQKGNNEVLSVPYSPDIENVPRLQNPISTGSIVSAEPDLLIDSYSGLFSDSSGVTLEAAARQNIPTYVISDSCRQDPVAGSPSKLGIMDPWDAACTDIQNCSALTSRTSEATEALAEFNTQPTELQQAPVPTKRPRVLLFDSGTNELCISGRNGPPQGIIDAAGDANVSGNQDTIWFKASWESVAETQSDVIIVPGYRRGDADETKNRLETIRTQSALTNLDMVKQNRATVLPLVLFTSGYPSLKMAVQVHKGLEQMGMAPESPAKGKLLESLGYGILKN